MDDTTFRVETEKLLVDKEYWRKYAWLNNATANGILNSAESRPIEIPSAQSSSSWTWRPARRIWTLWRPQLMESSIRAHTL